MKPPLFICHANCCRSVLARYLYEHLSPGAVALGAGVEAGDEINDRALRMLAHWGIDASGHRPVQLTRELCDRAGGVFLMGPEYLRRLLFEYGADLADKAYLFADPFALPHSFGQGEYLVIDPSDDHRPVGELTREFGWFRERVKQIRESLAGRGARDLVAASRYLAALAR
jgi:protein-tyrosine-phosphatase